MANEPGQAVLTILDQLIERIKSTRPVGLTTSRSKPASSTLSWFLDKWLILTISPTPGRRRVGRPFTTPSRTASYRKTQAQPSILVQHRACCGRLGAGPGCQ